MARRGLLLQPYLLDGLPARWHPGRITLRATRKTPHYFAGGYFSRSEH